jgi:hypothetical protein
VGKLQGQVVGISRSTGGGNYQGQVGGYLGEVVWISRSSGGDIKVRGRGLEVKVKKSGGGCVPSSTPSTCTVLAQSEYKKRHDIFAKIIHMNLAVKLNLL